MGDSIMSSIIRATTTSGLQVAPDNSGSLQLQTNGTTAAVTIDTSQNVGIGTASPAYKVDINNAASRLGDTTGGFWQLGASSTASQNFHIGTVASDSTLRFYNGNYGSGTERMRIDSSGNVLINATAQIAGEKLNVTAGGSTINTAYFNFTTTDDRGNVVCKHARATGGTTGQQIAFLNASGTNVGAVNSTASATSYATSSDYRLKENVVPMIGALDKVIQLKPVTYTWKLDGSDGQGFIAHELQEIVPDCVIGEKDAIDEEGNPKYQGIDTSFLVATLTAAIQEQQTIINDLKARIETLEAK